MGTCVRKCYCLFLRLKLQITVTPGVQFMTWRAKRNASGEYTPRHWPCASCTSLIVRAASTAPLSVKCDSCRIDRPAKDDGSWCRLPLPFLLNMRCCLCWSSNQTKCKIQFPFIFTTEFCVHCAPPTPHPPSSSSTAATTKLP